MRSADAVKEIRKLRAFAYDPDTQARLNFIPFPERLVELKRAFLEYGQEQGLDPGEIIFDFLDHHAVSEAASYGGFPSRYPHWRFGMAYDQMRKMYTWGLSTVYEMVINNRPAFAYLLQGISEVMQRMVMAHVIGHCDFFRRNAYFAGTNRNMLNEMANHAARARRYGERYGFERVERFLDAALSLENLIDPGRLFEPEARRILTGEEREEEESAASFSRPYLDVFSRRRGPAGKGDPGGGGNDERPAMKAFPEHPVQGVLDFLVDQAPLEDWERDLLDIIRDEAYYYLPQKLTKIMNEGWAVFWHSRIMVHRGLRPEWLTEFADENAKILAAKRGQLNPYRLGFALFEHIRERWDKGRHGPDWERCTDRRERRRWDTEEGRGMEKIFQVRSVHNDAQFVEAYLTPEFVSDRRLFVWRSRPPGGAAVLESRDFEKIRETLVSRLHNGGEPVIHLVDANHRNRSELYLLHRHDGVDLEIPWARRTLRALFAVWRRPVSLETVFNEEQKVYSYDGEQDSED